MSPRPNIELTPDEQTAFLLERHKCALATYGPDGFPHIVAMNFFVKDDVYCMTSYGKAQKVLNIRRNPKVALMIEAGDAYGELRGMMIRGVCEIIEDPDAVLAALTRRTEARGNRRPPAAGAVASASKRVLLKVTPHKVTSWDHRKLGGRY
jgi:PPOX class probable F420-dependent enzyme